MKRRQNAIANKLAVCTATNNPEKGILTEEEAIEILKKKNPEFNDEQFQALLTIE